MAEGTRYQDAWAALLEVADRRHRGHLDLFWAGAARDDRDREATARLALRRLAAAASQPVQISPRE
jgi:hypothetical protein